MNLTETNETVEKKIPITGLVAMPEAEYHAHSAISKSGLDQIAITPKHYQNWLRNPKKPTDDMRMGSYIHRLILEPELFRETCVVEPEELTKDCRNKDGSISKSPRSTEDFRKRFAEWSASVAGKTILTPEKFAELEGMANSWAEHPHSKIIHRGAMHEISVFWVDKQTGLHCRARLDVLASNGLVFDLKRISDVPTAFKSKVVPRRYHVQAAWYLDGLSAATGEQFDDFMFTVIEATAPYSIKTFRADRDMIRVGRIEYQKDFDTYATCLRTGVWPSFPAEVESLSLPAWKLQEYQ